MPNSHKMADETAGKGRYKSKAVLRRCWAHFDPNGEVPAGVPLADVLAAGEEGLARMQNPIDGKRYSLSSVDGSIILPPRTVVATPVDYGIEFPRAIFIDSEGIFYIILDTDKANSSSTQQLYASSDHGYNDTQGFDIGPDGSFYLGATTRESGDRVTHAVRGLLDPATGVHSWSTIASTERIPPGSKNHPHPGVTVSPDGRSVFINSGSRTDHGEQADGLREVPLSATILRVPTDGEGLIIPADGEALRKSGFLFADGFRNAFDTAFAGNGDLFAGDNGPDSDQPEAVSWVREGHHYGFPWRIGGINNPTQFPDYDPTADNYILHNPSRLVREDRFNNDPSYPGFRKRQGIGLPDHGDGSLKRNHLEFHYDEDIPHLLLVSTRRKGYDSNAQVILHHRIYL